MRMGHQQSYKLVCTAVVFLIAFVLIGCQPYFSEHTRPWLSFTNITPYRDLADKHESGRTLVLYQITAVGTWPDIVRDQITKMVFSGLYAQVTDVHCTVFGSSPNATSDVSEVVNTYGSKFRVVGLPGAPNVLGSIASIGGLTATDRVLFLSTYGAEELEPSAAAHDAFL